MSRTIELTAKEALLQLIRETQEKYPVSLKVKDVIELMNCSQTQAYDALASDKIPGAKKIVGLGWRINRDVFLAWLYTKEDNL